MSFQVRINSIYIFIYLRPQGENNKNWFTRLYTFICTLILHPWQLLWVLLLRVNPVFFSVSNWDSRGQKEKNWRKKQNDGKLNKQRSETRRGSSISTFQMWCRYVILLNMSCNDQSLYLFYLKLLWRNFLLVFFFFSQGIYIHLYIFLNSWWYFNSRTAVGFTVISRGNLLCHTDTLK